MKKPFQYILVTLLSTLFVTSFISNAFGNLKKHGIIETDKTERSLVFSGITWQVRNRAGNPGGNHWSDSKESVWVDENGILHLTIRNINGEWYCSEIYSDKTVGYGEYKFYVSGNLADLDKNVVLGLFTYLNDKSEIDIEFSKWGENDESKTGNYVVQPSHIKGNSKMFQLNSGVEISTHQFIWESQKISFKSWSGHDPNSSDSTLIDNWDYTGKYIPVPATEKLILNLWLYKGKAPSNKKEVEVLIKAVELKKHWAE